MLQGKQVLLGPKEDYQRRVPSNDASRFADLFPGPRVFFPRPRLSFAMQQVPNKAKMLVLKVVVEYF